MNKSAKTTLSSGRGTEIKRTVVEALLVAAAAMALAFAANALSPRGLKLSRNYFPGKTNNVVSAPVSSVIEGLRQKGLHWVDAATALRLFHDPRFSQRLIVFIDARNQEQYQEGHIPGAYEFDPYHPGEYLPAVLPACQAAERIVVYCDGGNCEDSQFAAVALRDAGIENQKLAVFTGGMSAWSTNGWPVETGARDSGRLKRADS